MGKLTLIRNNRTQKVYEVTDEAIERLKEKRVFDKYTVEGPAPDKQPQELQSSDYGKLVKDANDKFAAGEISEAKALYVQAYAIKPTKGIEAKIAECEAKSAE